MSGLALQFRDGAVFFPRLNLWLDAHEPQPTLVFVSHAHSDHVAPHREVILSEPTARLMQARLPGERREHVLRFGQTKEFSAGGEPFAITLLPAGHIFGSAMALVQAGGEKLLYTGDFKLRRSLSAEPCEPTAADVLVMETTFGRPAYRFPPVPDVLRAVVRFCREALDNDETPVLLGYSLGKSQELLCGLGEAGLPIMLHGAVWRFTEIYKGFGQCFPPYERYDAGAVQGKVLLCPPNVTNSAMLRKIGKTRTAILTGWAADPNCRYRYRCDAAFALSDHADFPELVEMVRRVQPKLVYTLHGFAAEFARSLRELGFDARPLTEDEQLDLALPSGPKTLPLPAIAAAGEESAATGSPLQPRAGANAFAAFAETCAKIGSVPGKLEKIRLLSEYLKCLRGRALHSAVTWFTGRPFPTTRNRVMQLGWAVIRDAVGSAAGADESGFHAVYLKHSDLGETTAELLQRRTSGGVLSVESMQDIFEKLQAARGPLAKTPLLAGTLRNCSPLEARYLIKVLTGDLRIGLKEGLVEQAVASAFGREEDAVRKTALLVGDLGEVAELAADDRLAEAKLTPFRPVKFMLASPEPTAAAVWERIRERRGSGDQTAAADALTVWLEDKYDGIRCQLHKVGSRVELYSRDLKEITTTFLELADSVRGLAEDLVLDGEIVPMRGELVLPFAELQRRLGRRQGDLFMRDEVPVAYVAFDLLWMAGETLLNEPLRQRRARLEALKSLPACLRLARLTPASSAEAIDAAFDAARQRGNEGLMIKDPESAYSPGRRGLAWLKLKKALATLDCVVIGAEYGHGKRSQVLSDYTFAVRNDETGELATIGKAYTGLTDAEIAELTQHFLRTARRRHGRYFEVPPDTILEIAFDRLQKSDRHSSGLAMRFPRIVRIRKDKTLADIDTIATARRLVEEPDRPRSEPSPGGAG